MQSFPTDYADGALSLTDAGATGAAGAGGTMVDVLIEPESMVVPQLVQPDEAGAPTYDS